MIHQIKKAVIPAAGLGTRFLPATKACPMTSLADVMMLVASKAIWKRR